MLLRSSSVPSLGALAADGDHHDSSPACLRSSQALFGSNTSTRAVLSSKPLLPMRRVRSEADLQSFLLSTDHRNNAGEHTGYAVHPGVNEQLSIEVEKRDSSTFTFTECEPRSHDLLMEGDFHHRRTVRGLMTPGQVSCSFVSGGLYSIAEMGNTGPILMASRLTAPSKADALAVSSEGGMDGRDPNGGGRSGSDGPSGSSYGDSDLTDLRYKKLLQADPQNSLLLRNYAQYLSETKHEHKRAEEYYERSILACPSDGEVLSRYAKHVWDVHKDAGRAGSYFEQAVKATPEDCHVLGSYAAFLWQCDEDEATPQSLKPEYPPLPGKCITVMASA